MNTDVAAKKVLESVNVTREDIARAKAWILGSEFGRTDTLVESWLAEQKAAVPLNAKVDLMASDCEDQIAGFARAFSIRLAFYQAQWELISAGELFPADGPNAWSASLGFKTGGHSGGLQLNSLGCPFPAERAAAAARHPRASPPTPTSSSGESTRRRSTPGSARRWSGRSCASAAAFTCRLRRCSPPPRRRPGRSAASPSRGSYRTRNSTRPWATRTRASARRSSKSRRRVRLRTGRRSWKSAGRCERRLGQRGSLDDEPPEPAQRPALGQGEELHRRPRRSRLAPHGNASPRRHSGIAPCGVLARRVPPRRQAIRVGGPAHAPPSAHIAWQKHSRSARANSSANRVRNGNARVTPRSFRATTMYLRAARHLITKIFDFARNHDGGQT